jgi:hypothetical protein
MQCFPLQADDFISLMDIAKHKEPDRADQVIQNWMRNRNTVEFLGISADDGFVLGSGLASFGE